MSTIPVCQSSGIDIIYIDLKLLFSFGRLSDHRWRDCAVIIQCLLLLLQKALGSSAFIISAAAKILYNGILGAALHASPFRN